MKKRFVNIALSLVLTASLFAGCGKDAGKTPDSSAAPSDGSAVSQDDNVSDGASESKEDASNPAGETVGTGQQEETKEPPILKEAVADIMGCRIGCAATEGELNDEKVWEIITTHFNAITFGNELKPDAMVGYSVTTCPGTEEAELNGETILVPKLDYSRAERMLDKIYDWNQANPDNEILVKGHVLVWHAQTPEWFFHVDYDKNKAYVDKETMNKRLEWYIRTMLTHFTGEDSKYKDLF